MKRALLVVFSVVILVICISGTMSCSCDRSVPKFEGDPISITGSTRWTDDWVYLDVVITNNTDKGILGIRASTTEYRLVEGDTDFYQSSLLGGEDFGKTSPSWLDKLKKPTIGANGDRQVFSISLGPPVDYDKDTGEYYNLTAYRCILDIERIIFDGYGTVNIDYPLEFTLEGYRAED